MFASETKRELSAEVEIILVRDRDATLGLRCFLILVA
jgi:hypothetical protein